MRGRRGRRQADAIPGEEVRPVAASRKLISDGLRSMTRAFVHLGRQRPRLPLRRHHLVGIVAVLTAVVWVGLLRRVVHVEDMSALVVLLAPPSLMALAVIIWSLKVRLDPNSDDKTVVVAADASNVGVALATSIFVGAFLLFATWDLEQDLTAREVRRDNIRFVREVATQPDVRRKPFDGFDLRGAQLSRHDLSSADMSDADLSGAVLRNVDLRTAVLQRTDMSDADLSNARLGNADLTQAVLSGADLSGADLSATYLTGADLSDADLERVDFTGSDLSDATLDDANLTGATLRGADLTGADLGEAQLPGADLSDAFLVDEGASFRGADLSGADLSDADLFGADLTGADLRGADLTGADLTGATTEGALLGDDTRWPEGVPRP